VLLYWERAKTEEGGGVAICYAKLCYAMQCITQIEGLTSHYSTNSPDEKTPRMVW
jgi:hypothetical protein